MSFVPEKNIPLKELTTLKIGGPAEYFADIKSVPELQEAIAFANEHSLNITVLGGGSNVLIADEGIQGLVLHFSKREVLYESLSGGGVRVIASAGTRWDSLVEETTERDLFGLENLSGIPGTVGAAPVQNINAYGVSVGDLITKVHTCDRVTGEIRIFSHDECSFGYRDSLFKRDEGRTYIITSVEFLLTHTKDIHTEYRSASQSIQKVLDAEGVVTPRPRDIRNAVLTVRKNIGMLEGMYQSAGSFFKNTVLSTTEFQKLESIILNQHKEKAQRFSPWYWKIDEETVKVSTAFLVECTRYNKSEFSQTAFRGVASVSPLHSLSLINVGHATARDMLDFVSEIQETIVNELGVRIEPEVCHLL